MEVTGRFPGATSSPVKDVVFEMGYIKAFEGLSEMWIDFINEKLKKMSPAEQLILLNQVEIANIEAMLKPS